MSYVQDLILRYTNTTKISHSGFHNVRCPVCNDYKIRAGFKFESDGIGYNCFNCATKFKYQYGSYCNDNMINILSSFGISKDELIQAVGKDKIHYKSPYIISKQQKIENVELPNNSFKLSEIYSFADKFEDVQNVINYLNKRKISFFDYDLYYSFALPNYFIIPYYQNKKIVYWNSRNIYKRHFLKCNIAQDGFLFNRDNIFKQTGVLLITEGEINCLSLGTGVALGGSKITENIFSILNSTNREKIFIIDNDNSPTSYNIAQVMIEHGYGVTYLSNFKDANDSIRERGKLLTLHELHSNVHYGLSAKCLINILKVKNGCNL